MQKREFKLDFSGNPGWKERLTSATYEAQYISYFLVESIGSYTVRPIDNGPVTCREDATSYLAEALEAGDYPADRARICIELIDKGEKSLKDKFDRWMNMSEKLFHIVEGRLRWRKTRIHKIKDLDKASVYYLLGSARWLMSSHTFSIWLLLARAGRHTRTFANAETWDDLERIARKPKCPESYFRSTFKHWWLFLKNLNKIYPDYSPAEHIVEMVERDSAGDVMCDGISAICNGCALDNRAQMMFNKIVKKE